MAKQYPPLQSNGEADQCGNCKWFRKRQGLNGLLLEGVGDCFRYPPNSDGTRPLVKVIDLCGEYKRKP